MKSEDAPILFVGPEQSPLLEWLRQNEKNVLATGDKIDQDFIVSRQVWFLISYGYRHIIKKDVLDLLPGRAINLHISYLPFNRGADPNLWSILEGTPAGVTIHYLDEGVDTGDIIVQKPVELDFEHDTLATSYERLQHEIQALFRQHWPEIRAGKCQPKPQTGTGTAHKVKDRSAVEHLLIEGWNTPIARLAGLLR
ncbi:MAG: formyltransferase family protein [Candidatus Riflebacteria bacterium]